MMDDVFLYNEKLYKVNNLLCSKKDKACSQLWQGDHNDNIIMLTMSPEYTDIQT